MTKKDFIELAEMIAEMEIREDVAPYAVKVLKQKVIRLCKRKGKRFDEDIFENYIREKVEEHNG